MSIPLRLGQIWGRWQRHWLVWLLLVIAASLALPLAAGGRVALQALVSLPLHWWVLLLSVVVAGDVLTVRRWQLLLRAQGHDVPLQRGLSLVWSVGFVANVTPGGGGAPAAAVLLLQREGVRQPVSAAVFAINMLVEALVVALIMAAGALLLGLASPGGDGWRLALQVALALLSLSAALLFYLRQYRLVARWAARVLASMQVRRPWRRRAARAMLRAGRSAGAFWAMDWSSQAWVLCLCALQRGLHYSLLFLCIQALGGGLGWAQSLLVQLSALFGGRLSMTPGGALSTELLALAMLVPLLGPRLAAAAVLPWRFLRFYFYIIAGAVCLASTASLRPALGLRKTRSAGQCVEK